MPIDDIDMKILQLLQEDSSTPYNELANKLGVSSRTVRNRVAKLKDSGIITGFTIDLNKNFLGERSVAYMLLKVNPGSIESVSEKVCELPAVSEVHEVHALGDLLIKIQASNQEQIRNILVNNIRKINGIIDSDLLPVYKSWKEEILPTLDRRTLVHARE
jgi:Lrp/AsnC family transcriptional regulator for asnA, asnC and gidA